MDEPPFKAPQPRLSVAISTFRRPQGLARLLSALKPQVVAGSSREVIVVNDGSDDARYQRVVRSFGGMISYHPLPANVGIARARNQSTARASGEYLVFTDDDCEPPPFWLDWLEARLDAAPEIDVVVGTTLPRLSDRPRFMERVNAHFSLLPEPHGASAAPLFATANVAIRRSLFESIGGFGFGEEFMGAGEDTELAARLAAAGARTIVDRDWYVRHEVSDGLMRQMRRYWRYGYANVWMKRFTTSPSSNDYAALARRSGLFGHAKQLLAKNIPAARDFSNWPVMRWSAAALASLVLLAYYDGCAAAAAARRREIGA